MSEHASLPLANRIALVVGASRGIGYETALALAKAGAHVVATARTQGGLEELDDAIFAATGQHATLVPFDLVDGGAIDRLGGALFERFGKLDIWVQAAATMGPSGLTPVAHAEPREFAKIEKINFTGVYRLIRSLEPLLRASDAGRAVYLTTSVAATPAPSGACMRRPRPGPRPWSNAGPTRSKAPPSAPASSIRAGCAPSCARKPFRAKIPRFCPILRRSARLWSNWPAPTSPRP